MCAGALGEQKGVVQRDTTGLGWPPVHVSRLWCWLARKVPRLFVFQNSKPHAKLENSTCFPPLTKTIHGVDIPVLIVADSAYSLSRNVMKPFPEGVARGPQLQFSACLSRARIHVEHAFGRLKGSWFCLMKRNDSQTTNIKFVVAACIVLHNFCESWKLGGRMRMRRPAVRNFGVLCVLLLRVFVYMFYV